MGLRQNSYESLDQIQETIYARKSNKKQQLWSTKKKRRWQSVSITAGHVFLRLSRDVIFVEKHSWNWIETIETSKCWSACKTLESEKDQAISLWTKWNANGATRTFGSSSLLAIPTRALLQTLYALRSLFPTLPGKRLQNACATAIATVSSYKRFWRPLTTLSLSNQLTRSFCRWWKCFCGYPQLQLRVRCRIWNLEQAFSCLVYGVLLRFCLLLLLIRFTSRSWNVRSSFCIWQLSMWTLL